MIGPSSLFALSTRLTEMRKYSDWSPWLRINSSRDGYVAERFRCVCKASVSDPVRLRAPQIRTSMRYCSTGGDDCETGKKTTNVDYYVACNTIATSHPISFTQNCNFNCSRSLLSGPNRRALAAVFRCNKFVTCAIDTAVCWRLLCMNLYVLLKIFGN
jgi:hypothetical protein